MAASEAPTERRSSHPGQPGPDRVVGDLRAAAAREAAAVGLDNKRITLSTGLDTLTNEATGNTRKPRPGACTYLMFDIHDMSGMGKNGAMKKLLAEFRLLANTADYHISTENGFLTVLGTAERATNSLLALGKSIQTIAPAAKVFIGPAEIGYTEDKMVVSNLPMGETRQAWQLKPAGLYITEELAAIIEDKGKSREGSHFTIETTEPDDLNLRTVLSYKPKVSTDIGGPDKLVGYENEGDDLNFHLRDDETRLIILKGEAGIGKSRLLNEQLLKLPSHILCSLDGADKSVPGSSLVTLAAQLATIIEEDPILRSEGEEQTSAKVVSFSRLPIGERKLRAQRNPAEVADMCSSALQIINFTKGQKTPLVIEDLHHADRHSEKWILEIAKRYLEATDGEGKVLISMRPGEMYESTAQKDLEKWVGDFYGEDSTHELELKGLDFSNPEVSYEYCFHSLPAVLRQGKTLGDWHKELGKRAGRNPLIMTTLMATLLENPTNFATTDDGVINVKEEAIAKFANVSPDDPSGLAGVYHQRIKALDEGSRAVLQAIALAGGKISAKQIGAVIAAFTGKSLDTFVAVTTTLIERGLVQETKGKDGTATSVSLKHEMTGPFILSSITDPEKKTMMANRLYGVIGQDPETTNDSRFAMLHQIASGKDAPELGEEFWSEYIEIASKCLADATDHNAYGSIYSLVETILDRENGAKRLRDARFLMPVDGDVAETIKDTIPENIKRFIAKLLIDLARSTLYLGKFKEMEQAVKDIKRLLESNPNIEENEKAPARTKGKIALVEFEAAYVESAHVPAVKKTMSKIYTEQIQSSSDIPTAKRAEAGIKFFSRMNNMAMARKIYDDHIDEVRAKSERYAKTHDGMPSPEFAEIERLINCRAPMNKLREEMYCLGEGVRLDEDCEYCPEALSAEQKAELAVIKAAFKKTKVLKEKFPGLFSPYSELGIYDQEVRMTAQEGDYQTAIKAAREAMRVANQMDLGNAFARHVNDLAILHFTTAKPQEAFKVLTREGKQVKSKLGPENFMQFLMRAQTVLSVGMICLDTKTKVDKETLTAQIQEAFKCFTELNQQYAEIATSPEGAYGLLGYISPILKKARELGIPLPEGIDDKSKYPCMDLEVVTRGIQFSLGISDKGIRNVGKTKRQGLYELFEGLSIQRDSRLQK